MINAPNGVVALRNTTTPFYLMRGTRFFFYFYMEYQSKTKQYITLDNSQILLYTVYNKEESET